MRFLIKLIPERDEFKCSIQPSALPLGTHLQENPAGESRPEPETPQPPCSKVLHLLTFHGRGERILRRENPMFLVGKWPLLFLNSGS